MTYKLDSENRQQPESFEGFQFVVNTHRKKLSREQKETVLRMTVDGLRRKLRLNEIGINIMMDYLRKSYIVHISEQDNVYHVDIY